ncbi:MAG TPA: isoprenylcysteine carboxylmethyltransferase family protein [Ghiorsea sp.]|nr:isoprenylcysteine carboxylmethyltransferase family protein [Ghiorsea sp.]HIP06801.1 isoprenylcysteine carboxylmethyltransferase family protein [Mariprofundaceae bacterium]
MTAIKSKPLSPYQAFFFLHRPRLTGVAALVVIFLAQPTLESLCLGTIFVFLGESGRTWALGYIEKDAELATSGPYAFTRNPLYVFNTMMFIGFCVMGNNLVPALIASVIFIWIYIVVISVEAERMVDLFGESYAKWSEHVPLFFPRFTPWKDRVRKAYSFALMLGHEEPKHWGGAVVGLAIFYGIYYFQQS